MKNTAFDAKRIAEGYRDRPYLHKQVIEQFQQDITAERFKLGLDIGCGAGLSTKAIKEICEKVIGADISPEMIQVAKEVCGDLAGYEYMVSKAEEITLPEQSVDLVTAAGAIQWIDREAFLQRLSLIMKTDGYLLIYDFAISDEMIDNKAYTKWWHESYLQEFPRPYRNEAVWSEHEVASYGFHMIDQISLRMTYEFNLESFINFMMIQSNVNVQIEEQGRNPEKIRQWFEESLQPIFGNQNKEVVFRGYSWYLRKS